MSVEIFDKKDFVEMPWKNGGGSTTELFRIKNPHNDSFYFRLSCASVSFDGPFSLFPNIDRILILLSGNGFNLEGPGLHTSMKTPLSPLYFEGETPINCTLVDGPCRDFNVMTDRGWGKSLISVERFTDSSLIIFKAECDFRFIYDKDEEKLYKLNKGDQYELAGVPGKSLLVIDVTLL